MLKTTTFLPVLAIFFSTVVVAESLLDEHTKAAGGIAAITKIKTIHRSAGLAGTSSFGRLVGTSEEIFDLTNGRGFTSMQLQGFNRQAGWSGDSGWTIDTQSGAKEMPVEEVELNKLNASPCPLVTLAAVHGSDVLKEAGEKEFNGKTCNVFRVVGSPLTFYVNQQTNLLEGMQLAKIYDVTFENYEEVEGVQLYGRSTVKIHAQELTIVSDYNTTKINSEIDTTKFKNPSATTKPTDSSASSNLAKRLIGSIDQDNDGMISKKEAPEDMRLFFADIDTNQDGFIDASEAVAMLKYVDSNDIGTSKETPIKKAVTAKDLIDHLDKNGDTMIGKDEASEELAPHFDHIDTDGNGFIDVEEAEVMAKYVNESQGK